MASIDHNVRRKGSANKLSGVLNALKRVSFNRRASSDSVTNATDTPTGQAAAPPPPPQSRLTRRRSSSSLAPSSSRVSSDFIRPPPLIRLNSSSPASELPKSWAEWTQAYKQGLIDFEDPPEPPSDLHSTDHATPGGILNAPVPETELSRQRAVDGIALLPRKRESKGTSPRTTSPKSSPTFDPKELPTYSALEQLTKEAQNRFEVETASVSLVDRDHQLFLAKQGFLPPDQVSIVDRQEACCSHTILKACSTGGRDPLVVLDFSKDWRFQTNTFGDHGSGFYAAAPILLPSALGDGGGSQPGGVFCVLGKTPRSEFSSQDRHDLEAMADKASKEIQRWAEQGRADKKKKLAKTRQGYRQELARSASQRRGLDTVDEIPTPPLTPDLSNPEDESPVPRRPSLAESANSEKSLDLKTTSATPAFGKRRGRQGMRPGPAVDLPEDLQSVIDLSTQLVAESIEMEFSYVMAIDLVAAAEPYDPERPSPLRLVSSHGMPIPAPQFAVDLHLDTISSPHNALLYVNSEFTGIAGEFSTGLLVKIGAVGDTGYVLGTFTEDSRRVLNQEDLLFLRSFSRDIGRQLLPSSA
ncbi:hypothetical protein JCM10212_001498 [Sporobolomyces blumeae]